MIDVMMNLFLTQLGNIMKYYIYDTDIMGSILELDDDMGLGYW